MGLDQHGGSDREEQLRFFRILAATLLLLHPATALAQTVWDMPTEYPQSAMPGLGITTFAKRLSELSAEKLQIKASFDASTGIRSAGMLAAIAEGRVQAGDALAGALEAEDAIFALPTLLYLTPWPPSGIWSKAPLKAPSDLSGLSIRTYDKISSEVFASVGAKATTISFADTMSKLVDGSINAVLSSGDGGAGRKLWEYLPYFTEITYSLPLSVASVSQAVYDGLDQDLRQAVDAAGRQTEVELWLALSTRLQENYRRMRQNGVTIDSSPAPAMMAALQGGAAAAQQAWCARSGPV